MLIKEAKQYVGRDCLIQWADRSGEHSAVLNVEGVIYERLYGAYLLTDRGELRVDKIATIQAVR